MNFADYQRAAERTMTLDPERFGHLVAVFALGLAGESGEVIELVKKHIGHGQDLDRLKLRKELGDVLWYLAALCSLCSLDLGDVAAGNIEKLKARYPDGFSKSGAEYLAARARDGEGSR